jgi:hypothetical protein
MEHLAEALNALQLAEEHFLGAGYKQTAGEVAEIHKQLIQDALGRKAEYPTVCQGCATNGEKPHTCPASTKQTLNAAVDAYELGVAWKKYTDAFGEPPYGTHKQLCALVEFLPKYGSVGGIRVGRPRGHADAKP